MAIVVTPGLARQNEALMKQHLQTLKNDRQQRRADGDRDLAEACKEAGNFLHHRGRVRRIVGVGKFA